MTSFNKQSKNIYFTITQDTKKRKKKSSKSSQLRVWYQIMFGIFTWKMSKMINRLSVLRLTDQSTNCFSFIICVGFKKLRQSALVSKVCKLATSKTKLSLTSSLLIYSVSAQMCCSKKCFFFVLLAPRYFDLFLIFFKTLAECDSIFQ